ncbi:hypothetical protein [Cohnella thailandensis]|uniref:Uncharacterized protein n=1 Tax=Cohnella thailandensis TaxID=557557 RepID=A0A841T4E5_9BACL|nr:hypothetical protein [Cohnella thailandensis]MBB6637869.1 hypothetical protein [Cohnella thailandensis]MBP1977423.1 hypothetical protein [Cohnella thailandensis]
MVFKLLAGDEQGEEKRRNAVLTRGDSRLRVKVVKADKVVKVIKADNVDRVLREER